MISPDIPNTPPLGPSYLLMGKLGLGGWEGKKVLVVDSVSFLFLFVANSNARQSIIPAKKETFWHQVCGSALDKEVLILFQFLLIKPKGLSIK